MHDAAMRYVVPPSAASRDGYTALASCPSFEGPVAEPYAGCANSDGGVARMVVKYVIHSPLDHMGRIRTIKCGVDNEALPASIWMA